LSFKKAADYQDWLFVFNEVNLRRVRAEYIAYDDGSRPHRPLDQRAPCGAAPCLSQKPGRNIVAEPVRGGSHHVYKVAARESFRAPQPIDCRTRGSAIEQISELRGDRCASIDNGRIGELIVDEGVIASIDGHQQGEGRVPERARASVHRRLLSERLGGRRAPRDR